MPLSDNHTRERFEAIIRGRERFNGKPFSHWQAEADELVIESILRAALPHLGEGNPSIIGYLAAKRLLAIALAENPSLVEKVIAKRNGMIAGFQRILASILGPD